MELTCPHCAARYRVASDAVTSEGREIHCAKCGRSWFERGGADATAPMLAHDGPLAEGVPECGGIELPAMPIGPAATEMLHPLDPTDSMPAWESHASPRAAGLGTISWVLLVLVLVLVGAGIYAYAAGLLKLP